MRENISSFTSQYEKIASAKQEACFIYAYEILLPSGKTLRLNSSGVELLASELLFLPFSGINLVKGEFDDSAENYIILKGIFEDNGITPQMNLAGCSIKIYFYQAGVLSPFVHWFVTGFEKDEMEFTIKCEPETIKYNQSLLLLFSSTCRASFGDDKCGIDINQYTKSYRIEAIKPSLITLAGMELASGYYTHGQAAFEVEGGKKFSFRIISHYNNQIVPGEIIPEDLLGQMNVSLKPACDKNFRTCCNKFNNAVNFRGEPAISEPNLIKNNG